MKKLAAILVCFILTGCAGGKSDYLNLTGTATSTASYSEMYEPGRVALTSGEYAEVLAKLSPPLLDEDNQPLSREEEQEYYISEYSELGLLERGALLLNMGEIKRALFYFDAAESKLDITESDGEFLNDFNAVAQGSLAAILGTEEMTDYMLRGYEKVMLFNYKALCYMLLGERKAYNVTRKAIDRQQEEWEKFKLMMAEVEADLEKEKTKLGENVEQGSESLDTYDTRSDYAKELAGLVPNAYVNPFGDFMNAVILEIDSLKSPALRDNARIAYSKVLDNQKKCYAAKQAIKDLKARKKYPNKKLVYVVLADSFAPHLVEKRQDIQIDKLHAIVKYPELTSTPSQLSTARIVAFNNRRIKPLPFSELSNMEAIIYRDEEDRMPLRTLMFTTALLRSGVASAFLGDLGANLVSAIQTPDTRSWLTLPNTFKVSRIYVPNHTKELTIATQSKDGKTLASSKVKLAKKGPTFVYATNYDSLLRTYVNTGSWIK